MNLTPNYPLCPSTTTQDGLTPLRTVKSPELKMALLKAGADPRKADIHGNTMLHVCESPGKMAALIERGQDLEATNEVRLNLILLANLKFKDLITSCLKMVPIQT